MKRTLSLILCVILLASSISLAAAEEEKLKITFWLQSSAQANSDKTIEAFEAAHPNIDVEPLYFSTDDLKKNTKIAASSGTLPTMWNNWGGSFASFYSNNDLSYDFAQYAVDHKWNETISQAAIDQLTFDGKLAGVPTALTPYSFIYSKPVLAAAGWENPPTTFAEFEKMLADVKASGVAPLGMAGKYGWHVMRFIGYLIEMYCGSELNNEMLKMNTAWDNEKLIQAVAKYKEYADAGYFPDGFITAEPNDTRMLVYAGIAGMTVGGVSEITAIKNEGFDINDFGVFNFPGSGDKSRALVSANCIQVNAKATEEELAACVEYAFFSTSPELRAVLKEANLSYSGVGLGARLDIAIEEPIIASIYEEVNAFGGMDLMDQGLPAAVVDQWFIVQDSIANGTMQPEEAGKFMDEQIAAYKATQE